MSNTGRDRDHRLPGVAPAAGESAGPRSGRRTQCKDNVKKPLRWLSAHVDTHKYLPSGGWGKLWTGDRNRGFGANQPGSSIFNILPYIEEAQLHSILASGLALVRPPIRQPT